MEIVYFYESDKDKEIKNILGTDKFMRLSYTTKIGGHDDKTGFHLYVVGDLQEIAELDHTLTQLCLINRVSEKNQKILIEKFKATEENAACGMGLIFG